jgi:2-oxoglutarate dehydrogenase E2 component (dihydrolipoamide succinyltransferase)
MPTLEMKVPSPGESISEVEIASWLVSDGDYVEKDQAIAEVDSDKATLELPAEEAGVITLKAEEGDAIAVGAVCCLIDTSAKRPEGSIKPAAPAPSAPAPSAPAPAAPAPVAPAPVKPVSAPTPVQNTPVVSAVSGHPSPAARKMMVESGLKPGQVKGTGRDGRVMKQDVLSALSSGFDNTSAASWGGSRDTGRVKMSMLRRKVAERLVAVKNETAMLTTFNEVDMKPVMDLRKQYKEAFKEAHGVGLGFMSFFTKAVTHAIAQYPSVNGMIDGKEMIIPEYADVGIAVSSPKGLMVPVLRNAESMTLANIEAEIKRLAIRARDGELTIDEMQGGTFTITNGGVFGSMLSTPIINPPQSAILGMHNIVERPVAINGQVEIRPVMYVALSYDHRIIDGKESVGFLLSIKEMIENPERLLFGGKKPQEVLLGL